MASRRILPLNAFAASTLIDMSRSPDRTAAPFERVLLYEAWWDCPRIGVCEVGGVLMNFDCRFSDELDEYPSEFLIWPAVGAEVDERLERWVEVCEWKSRIALGEPRVPFERTEPGPHFGKGRAPDPPLDAVRAVPEWALDRNRSFARRIPQHFVRWHALE